MKLQSLVFFVLSFTTNTQAYVLTNDFFIANSILKQWTEEIFALYDATLSCSFSSNKYSFHLNEIWNKYSKLKEIVLFVLERFKFSNWLRWLRFKNWNDISVLFVWLCLLEYNNIFFREDRIRFTYIIFTHLCLWMSEWVSFKLSNQLISLYHHNQTHLLLSFGDENWSSSSLLCDCRETLTRALIVYHESHRSAFWIFANVSACLSKLIELSSDSIP